MNLALIALVLASAVPKAGDDTELGSRLKPPTQAATNSKNTYARLATYKFVECGVERHPVTMRRVMEIGSPHDYEKMADMLSETEGCPLMGYLNETYQTQFVFDHASVRGMIGEAFLKKEGRLAGIAALSPATSYQRPWFALTTRPGPVDEMVACAADTAPDSIVALLRTEAGSPEEDVAMQGLVPAIGTCLTKGYTLHLGRLALRSAMAEALYHRVYDPPLSPAGLAAQGSKP